MAQEVENSTFHELLTFLVLEARISSLYYTELLELIQEKSGTSLEKWEKKFRRNLELKIFEILETLAFHFWIFEIQNSWIFAN